MEAAVAGATGLSRPVTASDQDLLNPEGVCCLRQDSVTSPVRVWGARTLASAGHAEWRYIAVRRMALALRNSLERGLLWTVFEPNDSRLWDSLGQTVGSMLSGLFRQGAFQGQTGKDSFYVRCGLGVTMSQADIDAGRAIVELGFAPLRPAEFVVLRLSCKAGSA
jgi:phage tail sheath protein FI